MPVSVMTSQERVQRMFTRQPQDRVPRHDTYWPDTIARWKGEGLDGDASTVLAMLDSDYHAVCWTWPQPFPGRAEVIREDDTTQVIIDGHGKTVRRWKHRSGTPEHIAFGCDSRAKWENEYKPALLRSAVQVNVAAARDAFDRGRAAGKWCHVDGIEGFEATRALIGDEIALMAMAEDPDWIRDISSTYCDLVLRYFDAVVDAGVDPDGVWIYGDMAFNHATMCSPKMYRELIWPDHKRLADWAHAHGAKCIFHTDGNVNGVIDLYLEAGFDCLQPLESKAGMDIRQLAPRYGDRLAMFGNIDVMVMGSNDLARIEHEVRTKFEARMAVRGYAYHSDHSVPPQVTWQTYQHLMQLIDRYGQYE